MSASSRPLGDPPADEILRQLQIDAAIVVDNPVVDRKGNKKNPCKKSKKKKKHALPPECFTPNPTTTSWAPAPTPAPTPTLRPSFGPPTLEQTFAPTTVPIFEPAIEPTVKPVSELTTEPSTISTTQPNPKPTSEQTFEPSAKSPAMPTRGVDVACPDQDPPMFIMEVSLPFVGRVSSLNQSEIVALQNLFVNTYKEFELGCENGSFREMHSVEIILSALSPSPFNVTFPFVLRHRARMSCRGCDTSSTLFQEPSAAAFDFRQLTQLDDSDYVVPWFFRLQDVSPTLPTPPSNTMFNLLPCPVCTGPTSASFLGNYSAALDVLVANSTITSIDYLGDQIVQLENIVCAEHVTEFFSDVFVEFMIAGNETRNVTEQERQTLEEAFRASYNALNSLNNETCDPFFREIIDVELSEKTDVTFNRRHLLPTAQDDSMADSNVPVHNTPVRPTVFLLNVRGNCRGCRRDARLYDEGLRRRSLIGLHNSRAGERQLQGLNENPPTTDDCVCAVQPEEFRAPTREEFIAVYNNTISTLVDAGELQFVEAVAEVVEVDQVECPNEVSNFTTTMFFDLAGFPAKMNASEEALIVDSFVFVYNSIVEEFCDPLFRTVTNANVVQLLDATGNPINDENPASPDVNVNYTVVFQAEGRCRECPPNSNLFDDGTFPGQRRLSLQGRRPGHRMSRRMEQESTCYCDTDATEVTEERTPSEAEFVQEFADAVLTLGLSSVAKVVEVEEPNPTASPTITASPTSSPFPSSAPSAFNEALFQALFNVPFSVDTAVFGTTNSTFPIYTLESRPDRPGPYSGWREDGMTFTLQVTNFVVRWPVLKRQGDFTVENSESDLVRGVLTGPTNVSLALDVLILTMFDESGAINEIQMTPFDSLNGAGATRQRALSESDLLYTNDDQTGVQSSRKLQDMCSDFFAQAFNDTGCLEFQAVITDQDCVSTVETEYSAGIAKIEQDRVTLEDRRYEETSTIASNKLVTFTQGSMVCVSSLDVENCVLEVHRGAVRSETNALVRLEEFVNAETLRIEEDETSLCPDVASEASTCFTCEVCSSDLEGVECCTDDECAGSGFCSAFSCLNDGSLRFTLEWVGDDDLDLHVITPLGTELDPSNPSDSASAGQWESSGSLLTFGPGAENVYFGVSDPLARSQFDNVRSGTYTYSVVASPSGLSLDEWTLNVVANGELVTTQIGVGSSSRFAYEVASPAPSASPSSTPSSSPSGLPSLKPSTSQAPTSMGPTMAPSPSPSISTIPPTIAKSSMPSQATPTPAPTPAPTTLSPTLIPSSTPSGQSAPSANPSDGLTPSDLPSAGASNLPSGVPSLNSSPPSGYPSIESNLPSSAPSMVSDAPTYIPSSLPSDVPTDYPSLGPTKSPVAPAPVTPAPSDAPTDSPSRSTVPSNSPSDTPTEYPSDVPSYSPSDVPSNSPSRSIVPSDSPSDVPSDSPSDVPSYSPSDVASNSPSRSDVPSYSPSDTPSSEPSMSPSQSLEPSISEQPTF